MPGFDILINLFKNLRSMALLCPGGQRKQGPGWMEGVEITNITTTERTKGYLANFNAESGAVIIVHTSGGKIEAGKGSIAEVVCAEGGSPTLSAIKLAK